MGRQHRAQEVGAVGAHQLAGVVGQYIHDGADLRSSPGARCGGPQRPAVLTHLTAGEGRGGGSEAPAGARVYGNTHHNGRRQGAAAARGYEGGPGWARRPPLGYDGARRWDAAGAAAAGPRAASLRPGRSPSSAGRRGESGAGCLLPPGSGARPRWFRCSPDRPARGKAARSPGRATSRPRAPSAAGGSAPPGGPETSSQMSGEQPGTVFTAGPPGAGAGRALTDGALRQWDGRGGPSPRPAPCPTGQMGVTTTERGVVSVKIGVASENPAPTGLARRGGRTSGPRWLLAAVGGGFWGAMRQFWGRSCRSRRSAERLGKQHVPHCPPASPALARLWRGGGSGGCGAAAAAGTRVPRPALKTAAPRRRLLPPLPPKKRKPPSSPAIPGRPQRPATPAVPRGPWLRAGPEAPAGIVGEKIRGEAAGSEGTYRRRRFAPLRGCPRSPGRGNAEPRGGRGAGPGSETEVSLPALPGPFPTGLSSAGGV